MTLAHHVIAFIVTAVVLLTVLVVGTLAAAELLPTGRRTASGEPDRAAPSPHLPPERTRTP